MLAGQSRVEVWGHSEQSVTNRSSTTALGDKSPGKTKLEKKGRWAVWFETHVNDVVM